MANLQLPPNISKLWQATEFPQKNRTKIVHKGSIINFFYIGQRRQATHDPYPLLLVSDIFTDAIRGINLNLLDAPYVTSLIKTYLDTPFSYANIKTDNYITNAFRTYKRNGISSLRMMDGDFLKGLAAAARSLDVNEIEQIRSQIETLIRQASQQPSAEPEEMDFNA
jgi:hypothetical protein